MKDDAEEVFEHPAPQPMMARPAISVYSGLIRVIHLLGWSWVRQSFAVLYFATLGWIVILDGVPTGRLTIGVIIVVGLAISSMGRGWLALRQVLLDWLPFTLVLVAYDKTRAVAMSIGMPLHESDVVRAEEWLCGNVPTVWLQQHLYSPTHVYWYDALLTVVYSTHFLATPALAAILWLRDRRVWVQYISRVIVLSIAGLVTYILFPEAPPWMASRDGFIAQQVERLSARGWIWLHLGNINKLLEHAQSDGANPVAAMPSLHTAFACLVAILIATKVSSRWRYLLALYPLAMGFALVYLGEHYVLDVIAGIGYAYAVHLAMNRWERRRAAGQDQDRATLADGTGLPMGKEDLDSLVAR